MTIKIKKVLGLLPSNSTWTLQGTNPASGSHELLLEVAANMTKCI